MTTEQLQAFAAVIVANIPTEQYGEFADILFDEIYDNKDQGERDSIAAQLLDAGLDVGPICKKKRPQ